LLAAYRNRAARYYNYFEQGEVAALERAVLTAPAMQAGLALMQKLVAQIQRPS
jgi:hypothetical protein